MARSAEALEEFVDEFERYTDFVDETRSAIHTALVSMRETTFAGELGTKFEDVVRSDVQEHLTSLHEEFSSDLVQLRTDIEYIRSLESGAVNI